MDNTEYAIYKIPDRDSISYPTRICMICDQFENPKCQIANALPWLCPECKQRLKKLLYPENNNGR